MSAEDKRWDKSFEAENLLYSDNAKLREVTEAMNLKSELFSDKRLKESLSDLEGKDITNIIHEIRARIKTFAQEMPQSDDITMLALKYNGKGT